jgi:O-antigen ligase
MLALLACAPAACWIVCGASRWAPAFLLAALLLPPLPLPWGDSGVHISVAIAALGLWAGVVRPGRWRVPSDPVALALITLFFVLLVSVPLAALYSGPFRAAGSLARVGLFGIGVYLYLYLSCGPGRVLDGARLLRLILWAGVASAAFAVLDFRFQFPAPARFAEQLVWLSSGILRRAQGVFYEASTLGVLCAFLLTLMAAIAFLRMAGPLRIGRGALALAALITSAALMLSFSRAAVVNLVVSLGALLYLNRGRLGMRWKSAARMVIVAFLVGAATLACIYWLAPDFSQAYVARLRLSGEFFFSEPNYILSRRLESWAFLANHLQRNPLQLLFGIGYKTLPYTEHLGRPVVADNMYLSLLIEAGIAGLLALLLLNGAVLWESYRQARSQYPLARLCGTSMFAFWCGELVQMASGDVLTYWRILPVFFAVLAVGARDGHPVS